VLVAETPFERYSTADGKTYHEWTRLVKDSSLDVSYLLPEQGKPVLRDLDLSRFDCVLVPAAALDFLTPGDAKRARDYAEKGGRVIVAANHFFGHSVQGANSILAGSGLEIIDKEASPNGQNDVTLRENDFDPRLVKFGVKSARFFRASPIRITDSEKPRVLAQAVGVGNPGDGFVAMTKVGKGEMLALGESLWCFWITKERAKGTDNAKLLLWLLMRSRE
jgi:hypothetical protein